MPTSKRVILPLLLILLVVAFFCALSLGPSSPDWANLWSSPLIRSIRLPRALVALGVGAALALAGTILQAIFHNPLADPGIIGVSSGAALGAVIAMVSGATATYHWALPAAAFLGAILTAILVYAVASRRGADPITLVLVGIAASAFLGAITASLVANAPQDSDLRGIAFWMNGDLVARQWRHVPMVFLPLLIGVLGVIPMARRLDLLLLGEDIAHSTGVNVRRTRFLALAIASLITAGAVSVAGIIGFVGLVIPHLIRLVIGPRHGLLLPSAAIAGAAFLLFADTLARLWVSPFVFQTGTMIAFLGSPVFLWLLLRSRGKWSHP
ncbi:iron chelate uptake ABC transporter family permease subunit [Corynebacterium sp. 3HC-13]|uniref:FecCD family ABC transporter permease n=1 Tax=Corynebacterium poyangense TaxID=2684405 RepID=UPI001CCA2820|nr:iron ABC transporter permease [Corynebacterium poyangense]MBZ8176353.1 iron chelate uptake ABC transporter family permease subunit [Corynebacterium poyangense]